MIVFGLTGGIGMGKSTVARMLREMGIPVFDADRYVHRALGRNGWAVNDVERLFRSVCGPNGIDRQRLAAIVLKNPDKRKKLESVLHPLVWRAEKRFVARHKRLQTARVVLDIPLLYETGAEILCDVVICVHAPERIRRMRVLLRPGMTSERFAAIRRAQMPERERHKRADFILQTGGSHEQTQADLQKLLNRVKQKDARNRSGYRNHRI